MATPEAEPDRAQLRAEGAERRRKVQGAKADTLQNIFAGIDPVMANWADEWIFGQVWARPGMTHEERTLVAITALAATEHPNQLRLYLHGALQDGMSARKIHEALVMLCVYCGFPTALEAIMEWQSVLRAAEKQGLKIDLDGP